MKEIECDSELQLSPAIVGGVGSAAVGFLTLEGFTGVWVTSAVDHRSGRIVAVRQPSKINAGFSRDLGSDAG